ncbi:hypothetical protein I6F65_20985 [Pseudoalteromonas sp. SWXJZ94C]|uniref:hypothetical protein n=1 Tax=Pseudoalteromonas sp. SWXJZ94C TaxID=2792065 RepID=UPI0018CDF4DD|nr:hypothetical protein [Pseudoalteromonas sp. SWXJZ94C]MBH0059414.1 hypothetical protein [Pseudoalteromonas sp. SWXJZ94C]
MNINELPYSLPKTPKAQCQYLARICSISLHKLSNNHQEESEAIASVIIYRHLSSNQKIEAMRLIQALINKPLMAKLIEKITDTIVNPQWGIWSLSNTELLKDHKFHDMVNTYAGISGITISMVSVADLASTIWKTKKVTKGGWLTLVMWGSLILNATELHKVNQEISNRSKLLDSVHYD